MVDGHSNKTTALEGAMANETTNESASSEWYPGAVQIERGTKFFYGPNDNLYIASHSTDWQGFVTATRWTDEPSVGKPNGREFGASRLFKSHKIHGIGWAKLI
jgi:hypothetical protein